MSAWGREAALGTQTRWEDGEQAGAEAGCWGDVDTRGEKQGGRLALSTSWLRGSADRQAKARPIFLKKLQWRINAESVLLLEEANIKGRQALWKKPCHFRARLLCRNVGAGTPDSNRWELFPEPPRGLSGAPSTRAGLTVVGHVGSCATLCHPRPGTAQVRVPSPSRERGRGAAQHPLPPSDRRTAKSCSFLPLALFNIINLSGKF